MPVTQARNWCFTLHDWSDAELNNILTADSLVQYVVVGEEKCPDTGRPHLQGYVQLKEKCSFAKIKSHWELNRLHLEMSRGSPGQNYDYCTKEGKFHEVGEPKKQGRRTSFADTLSLVREGKRMSEILDDCDSYQVARGVELGMKYCEPQREGGRPEVTWIHGAAKKGRALKKLLADECIADIYYKKDARPFWHGYDRHRIVVIKAGPETHKLPLRALFSADPYQLETKGAYRQWVAEKVYVLYDEPCREIRLQKKLKAQVKAYDVVTEGIQKSGGNTKPQTSGQGRWWAAGGWMREAEENRKKEEAARPADYWDAWDPNRPGE